MTTSQKPAIVLPVAVSVPNGGVSTAGINRCALAQQADAGFRIYNDTGATIRYSKNDDPCGAGSVPVPAGQSVSEAVSAKHLNLFLVGGTHLNDGSVGSVTIEGVRYA